MIKVQMNLDETIFFQQATNRICGSLDISTTLKNCLAYLKGFMPINGIAINIYDPQKRIVENLEIVSDMEETLRTFGSIKLTREAIDYIEHLPPRAEAALILNQPTRQPVAKLVWQAMGQPESSFLLLHPVIDQQKLGVVFIFAKGTGRYQPEHGKRFSLLHDPFAIALSNLLSHREVLRLKEMLADDNRYLSRQLRKVTGDRVIGANRGLKQVFRNVEQVAPLATQVLLVGETGTGKEVIANALHYSSPRADFPFIKVNCGAIPENLLESELFGHEQGAFTGAVQSRRGFFERADRGTIFLDEIGELSLRAQVSLLRVIQHRVIERVGGTNAIPLDIRIIAATHRNLEEMVEKGNFREDLWFRLNVFPIAIPPLRERLSDMDDLVRYFVERKAQEMNLSPIPAPSSRSIEVLKTHHWPGNVRELENVVERALIHHLNLPEHAPLEFETFGSRHVQQQSLKKHTAGPDSYRLDDLLKHHIESVLTLTGGRVKGEKGAAALLGINPSTLRNRMKKLNIPFGRTSKLLYTNQDADIGSDLPSKPD